MNIAEMAAALQPDAPTFKVRWAVVGAVNTGPPASVDLLLAGSTVTVPAVRRLASYSPTLSDVVIVLVNGVDMIVLGKLA